MTAPAFSRILIANRGEIACRVIRTARRMGISTVAVYAAPDAGALHVRMADTSVALGGSSAAESYLDMGKILHAVHESGAEAVHPGYGFLSERAAFAEALAEAGVAFIGPSLHAIRAMGDKIESKRLAAAAGVSIVPGHADVIVDADEAVLIARAIGYPVMIKASAGGGGKGMRLAGSDDEVRDGFRAAAAEALAAFGDPRLFIEKAIVAPRHIEIQVLGDAHGNLIHLGERECSIQRRHQKVIEEAPSPFLDEATRHAMGEQAVALARAVDYRSAGTVEFIVDQDRNFYFLEMNTRLQVEHPVTEAVTGLDLVEWMIRIAAGERLTISQDDATLTGSAIEARVYAEDPLRGFLPSTGRLTHYIEPTGEGIRVDAGVEAGAEISRFYDPMMAKLVAYGATRIEATERLAQALDRFVIRGVEHNLSFLAAIIRRQRFRDAALSTDFIPAEFPDGFDGVAPDAATIDLAVAVAASAQILAGEAGTGEGTALIGPPPWTPQDFVLRQLADDLFDVVTGAGTARIKTAWRPHLSLMTGQLDGREFAVQIERRGIDWIIRLAGAVLRLRLVTRRTAALVPLMKEKPPPDRSKFLLSPMPGLLVSVAVEPGQTVKTGEALAVVEAMKMENVLRAARDGTILRLAAAPGDSLTVDQVILEFG